MSRPPAPLTAGMPNAMHPAWAIDSDRPAIASAVTWLHALGWTLLAAAPLVLTVLLKPWLTAFWHAVIRFWSLRLDWPWVVQSLPDAPGQLWFPQGDGTFLPSTQTQVVTCLALLAVWAMTALFSDRFHPLKVGLRALCLVQGVACAFFALWPASFPYSITRHMAAVLDMGYSTMLAVGPMLALGWGILKQGLAPKLLAPLGVLTYFALMLPHKVLLHAWLLAQGSVLFMPTLFMCFSALLDLWLFIALYAWLASRLPAATPPAGEPA